MTRSTNEISIEEATRLLGRMSEDGTGSAFASAPALQSFLNTIANNSAGSLAYGIPTGTNSRGPIDGSGLLTMSEAQANEITQQRIADRGMEVLPGDVIGPTEDLGIEDSIFKILMETIIGEQGIPEGVSAEAIAAIRGDFGPTSLPEELQEIAIEIAEAGGFDEWLAQQPQGDPGDLFDPDTGLESDTDFPLPEQVGINLEDFQTQFPDLNVEDYEDGMYTDPETGTVYVINMPPDLTNPDPTDPNQAGGGGAGGGVEGGSEGGGENTSGGGSVEGSEGKQDSIDDGFFRVENGTVYVRDLETNEWVVSPRDWGGLLGGNPGDGYYTDTGVRIDDGSEVNVGGDDESSGGANVTIIPSTGGTSSSSGGDVSGGGDQSSDGTGGTGGGSQTGDTGDTGGGQDDGSGTAGSGGGSSTGTGPGDGSGTGPGDGDGGGMLTSQKKQDPFKFMAETGYQPVAVPGMVVSPAPAAIPTINSNTALNSLFARLLS